MKFEMSKEWLVRKLAHCDDSYVGAAGTAFEEFKKDVEQRTVTPATLSDVPTKLGKVIRFVREQRGWTRAELAALADVDEAEVELLERQEDYSPKPRAVTRLADVCHFSRSKFIELAGHRSARTASDFAVKFAANSGDLGSITDDDYEAIRALVEVLSQDSSDSR